MERLHRIKKLKSLIKNSNNESKFAKIIINKTQKDYDQFIKPLLNEHWNNINPKFNHKLELAVTNVYALGIYSVYFFTCKKYKFYRNFLMSFNFNKNIILKLFSLIKLSKIQREKIIYSSTFVTLIDHIFDHELKKFDPEIRFKKIDDSIKFNIGKNSLAFLNALSQKIKQKEIEKAMIWAKNEVKSLKLNKSLREAGIRLTIQFFYNTIKDQVDMKNIEMMYESAYFVQMIDDYIDIENDINDGKVNPFIENSWNFDTIEKQYYKFIKSIEKIMKENGINENMQNLYFDCINYVLSNMIEKMASREAD